MCPIKGRARDVEEQETQRKVVVPLNLQCKSTCVYTDLKKQLKNMC